VAYETEASNLLAGDDNGVSDVADGNLSGGRVRKILWVSKSAAVGEPGNGPSHDPVISRPGSPVFFASEATNLQPNEAGEGDYHDRNQVQDIFFWNFVSGNASLQSRDSNNEIVGLAEAFDGHRPAPFSNPAASYYGNYIAFETSNPLLDLLLAERVFPGIDLSPREAVDLAGEPQMHQVYLRYNGPR
jgi:hypothetical protein